jgi:GT2 family glycosyltransferase/glycosyltransferase involved in cell wall biosynthesis
MQALPSVDIVLCVYNHPDLVANCVESVQERTHYLRWRLLLLDDGSDDFTREVIRGYAAKDSRIQLLVNAENLGFVGTANRGMQFSDADYVVLLNSDTVMSPGWLGKLVAVAQSDPRIGMVNPLSNEFVNLSVPMAPGASFLAMNELLEGHGPEGAFDIVTAVGYCLLIRRKALQELGYFDEVFGRGYCEDTDLHMRFTTHGWRVVAAPDTYVYHLGHGSFSTAVAAQRYRDNIKLFRQRWGEQYDRDYQAFLAADRLGAIRRRFALEVPETRWLLRQGMRCRRAVGFLARHRRKLPWAVLHPRRAMGRLRTKLWGEAGIASPSPAPTPTRAYLQRHTRRHAPSVVFVLHQLALYGGVLRIIELTNQLLRQGVEARLAVGSRERAAREILRGAYFEPMFFVDWEDLLHNFPCCDAAVATFFTTVGYIRRLVNEGKAKVGVNYLQDFEPWFCRDKALQEKALSSYALLEHRIVTSTWLQSELLARGFPSTVIPYGVNALQFYPAPDRNRSKLRVIAMARPHTFYRGFGELVTTLGYVHTERPDVEIALFGSTELSQHAEIPFPFVDLGVIKDRSELCRRYNESDLFVDTSHFQGFGLPALEAMACKLACVLTNVGGVNQYARHEVNALMVPPHHPRACAGAILRLLNDGPLRARLGSQGRMTVEQMSPREEAKAWIDCLGGICPTFSDVRSAPSRHGRAA